MYNECSDIYYTVCLLVKIEVYNRWSRTWNT